MIIDKRTMPDQALEYCVPSTKFPPVFLVISEGQFNTKLGVVKSEALTEE
jgi:hypothetical protein